LKSLENWKVGSRSNHWESPSKTVSWIWIHSMVYPTNTCRLDPETFTAKACQRLNAVSKSTHSKILPKFFRLDPRPLITKDHQNLNVGSRSTNWKSLENWKVGSRSTNWKSLENWKVGSRSNHWESPSKHVDWIWIHSMVYPTNTCKLDPETFTAKACQRLNAVSKSTHSKIMPKF
jgi:hypothetical protein